QQEEEELMYTVKTLDAVEGVTSSKLVEYSLVLHGEAFHYSGCLKESHLVMAQIASKVIYSKSVAFGNTFPTPKTGVEGALLMTKGAHVVVVGESSSSGDGGCTTTRTTAAALMAAGNDEKDAATA
ncbi:hypothetical protein FOZ63_018738, partial [Perkinsus olseni]